MLGIFRKRNSESGIRVNYVICNMPKIRQMTRQYFKRKKNCNQCNPPRGGGGGCTSLQEDNILGMRRWTEWHFYDWIDYNGIAFSGVTRMGSYIFGFWG